MIGTGTAISRLDMARNITLSGGARIQIERTKNEALFGDFRYANSGSAKIVSLVAGNPLLTLLAFLHARVVVSEDDEASLTIPLILDPRCDFTAKKDRGDYKAQYEKLGRLHDEASEAVFTAVQTYRDTVMVEMGKDPTLAKLFVRGRRPPTFAEITKGIADVTSDNSRLREMQRKHQNDMRKLLSSVRIYGLILAYTGTLNRLLRC